MIEYAAGGHAYQIFLKEKLWIHLLYRGGNSV